MKAKDLPEWIYFNKKVGSNGIHCLDYKNESNIKYIRSDIINRWISVKDRLPTIKKPVLLLTDSGAIEGYLNEDGTYYFITLWTHGCGCCGHDLDKVTYWMPLPEPPTDL